MGESAVTCLREVREWLTFVRAAPRRAPAGATSHRHTTLAVAVAIGAVPVAAAIVAVLALTPTPSIALRYPSIIRPVEPPQYESAVVPAPVDFARNPFLRQEASDAVVKLFAAFTAETGLALDVSSLPANCSLDQCFADTPQGQWLAANDWKYGFIVRYPNGYTRITGYEFEPWHLRFVGVELATELHTTGVLTSNSSSACHRRRPTAERMPKAQEPSAASTIAFASACTIRKCSTPLKDSA